MVTHISKAFAYGRSSAEKPILLFTFLEILSGIVYLIAARDIFNSSKVNLPRLKLDASEFKNDGEYVRARGDRNLVLWIFAAGMAMRILMMFSTPILEDDYYRYLWDGAVSSHGLNPYTHSPKRVLKDSSSVPPLLGELARESGQVAERINHPHLRTIYPPVAQLAFALAYLVKPWSLLALRIVLLFFDLTALVLFIVILKKLELSPLLVGLYWWNPVLIKEVVNSCHMDVVVVPFLLGMVLLAIHGRYVWASGAVALATGTKIWPILLIPLVLRPMLSDVRRLIAALSLFALLVLGIFIPVYTTGLNHTSGLIAYGEYWEMNDALFMGLLWIGGHVVKLLGAAPGYSQFLARVLVLSILFVLVIRLSWKKAETMTEFCEKCLFMTTALFLLSPTQFPWYYVWILPFLTIRPRYSLLLLTALLPLYYLRFYFYARDSVTIFDNQIVWIEYLPVFVLILWEWHRDHRNRATNLPKRAS